MSCKVKMKVGVFNTDTPIDNRPITEGWYIHTETKEIKYQKKWYKGWERLLTNK